MSVFPSVNHLVRFPVRLPGLSDKFGVAGLGSFGGQPWPWLRINVQRCQMTSLYRFVVTETGCRAWPP